MMNLDLIEKCLLEKGFTRDHGNQSWHHLTFVNGEEEIIYITGPDGDWFEYDGHRITTLDELLLLLKPATIS